MCLFMYSLFISSVAKKREISYARKDGETIGVYSKIIRNFLHSYSMHYTFLH